MRHVSRFALVVVLACLVAACGSTVAEAPKPTPTFTPTAQPTLPTDGIEGHAVTFTTSDGETLIGTLYGQGNTAVIFANMLRSSQLNWKPVALQTAARGYLALTFDYRGTNGSSGTFDTGKLPIDLAAAIDFVHQHGARHAVLAGASIGGAAVLVTAAAVPVDGVAVFSGLNDWIDLKVTADMLQKLTMPKLFAYSTGDDIAAKMRQMYQQAAPPKDEVVFPGIGHGTALFEGAEGPYTLEHLMALVQTVAQGSGS